ncbi:MAG: Mov34/MPN/PAD-1 family protein [Nitrososphaeria archaeon]
MIIRIPRDILGELMKHVSESRPIEAVGFLLGRKHDDVFEALELVKVRNAAGSPVKFSVDPQELLGVYRRADERGMEVVAVVHSHPGSTVPSQLDVQYMRLNPYVWIIISSVDFKMEAYVLRDNGLEKVRIAIV